MLEKPQSLNFDDVVRENQTEKQCEAHKFSGLLK